MLKNYWKKRWISLLLTLATVSSVVPHGTAQARNPQVAVDYTKLQPQPHQVAPVIAQHAPLLTLDVTFDRQRIMVGQELHATLTVYNHAETSATNLRLQVPIPADVKASNTSANQTKLWQWEIKELAGHSTYQADLVMQLTAMPDGEAVILHPTLNATELSSPIHDIAGILVDAKPVDTQQITKQVDQAVTLHSANDQIQVQLPAQASKEGLVISNTPYQAKTAEEALPPLKGFGAFSLEAKTLKGVAVHQFAQPVTINVRYTQAQLAALGISEADLTIFWYDPATKQWVPQPTSLDRIQGIATTKVNHFSLYQLGDGSSPSEAYLPSTQGWQVGLFNGAATYSYPIEVPAGPGGIKPSIGLSYNSAQQDGKSGQRTKQQAGWTGLGWNLDLGSISANKMPNGQSYYALAFNGIATDLVRGPALVANPNLLDPTHWEWLANNDSFVKVRALNNGVSDANRGAKVNGQWQPRYTWQVWTKDGVRFDFSEDVWWGWDNCLFDNQVTFESYKWQLSSVLDPSGNQIKYSYGRDSITGTEVVCDAIHRGQGKVDRDIWPTEITWGGDSGQARHRVEFISSTRTNDTQFEGAPNQYAGALGQPRQTRVLDAIRVYNRPTSTWELVRGYNFGYDYSLLSDHTIVVNGLPSANTAYPKLTLKNITKVANDGVTALPSMTFSYGTQRGSANYPNGNWNRLTTVNNGQGGTVGFNYATIATTFDASLPESTKGVYGNNRRVSAKIVTDGRGNSYQWNYSYTNPAYNSLGTILAPNTGATHQYANSAALYFNKYWDVLHDNSAWLTHKAMSEFRGHSMVVETDPEGNQIEHYFYQGDVGCNPTGQGSTANIDADACFRQLRDRELLKGKEYRTVVKQGNSMVLNEHLNSYAVDFYDYTAVGLSGIWRSFSYQTEQQAIMWEGTATPITAKTTFAYNPAQQGDGVQYGNLTRKDEYDASGALYRRTYYNYETLNTASSYLVDRPRSETVLDGQNRILAHTNYFYDGNTTQTGVVNRGLLTLVRKYYDLPLATSANNITLHSIDTSYGYDSYGNQVSMTTYDAAGSKISNGSTTTWSQPGSGSATSTQTTTFDSIYHALATQITPAISLLSESATYDYRMGTMTSVTDANGNVTSAVYDAFGRMAKLISPGDSVAMPTVEVAYMDYELPFRYSVVTREQSGVANAVHISHQFYDGLGRKLQVKTESVNNTQHIVTDYGYNGLSQVIKASTPRYVAENSTTFWQYTPVPTSGMLWTTKTYDALGRLLTATTPNAAQTRHVYTISGNLLMDNVIDPNRHRTQYRNDLFGRLVGVYELKGTCGNYWGYSCGVGETAWTPDALTSYDYNPLDLLTTSTDANNNITSMTYDSVGRKLTMTDPDMGTWNYSYDVDGNVVSQTDAKNQTLSFSYDAMNRLTAKKQGTTTLASYAYDQSDAQHPNGKGQRTSMTDASGSHDWGYTTRGKLAVERQTVFGQQYVTNRSYRADGKLATLTYPTGEVLTYGYNEAGLQRSISSSLGETYLTDTLYDALGQPLTTGYGNGVVTTATYEATSQRLASIQASSASGTALNRSYSYDLAGNVQTISNSLTSETLRYSYDDYNRLTAACAVINTSSTTCLGGSNFNQSYSYNKIGNLTSKAGVNYTYHANKPHAVATAGANSYSYDANGNMLSGAGRSYTWNIENQPTQISKANVTESYSYNGDNVRVGKVTVTNQNGAGAIASTAYIAGLVEYRSDGTLVSNYAGIASRTSTGVPSKSNKGSLVYLHVDHLGSISATTSGNAGTLGAVAQSQQFDPWGEVRSGGISSTEFNYTGQRKDAGTGLLFYNARYYDASLGRFISADSMVPNTSHRSLTVDFHEQEFAGKLAAENNQGFWFQMSGQQRQKATPPWGASNPQNLNRYSYVLNNPLIYTDPSGHSVYLNEAEANALSGKLHRLASEFRDLYTVLGTVVGTLTATSVGTLVTAALAKAGITGTLAAVITSAMVGLMVAGGIVVLMTALYWFAERLDNLADMITDANTPGGAGVALGAYDTWFGDQYVRVLNRTTGAYTDWDVPWFMGVPGDWLIGKIVIGRWQRITPGTWMFCGDAAPGCGEGVIQAF